jgi:mannose-6-phosphate isomerase-like protein (cupin superfamily)
VSEDLEVRHKSAEATVTQFRYQSPEEEITTKGIVTLAKTDLLRGVVQIVKRGGGENNLHYHSGIDSFWMVLKGRARFYGPDDALIGEFGPLEGTISPRFARYWFENAGDGDLELLQVMAFTQKGSEMGDSGRTNVSDERIDHSSITFLDART